jgi:prephenate dehydrogenase
MSSDFTIAIWGVGLIGGSLGQAWRRAGIGEVIGVDQPSVLEQALAMGAIDRAVTESEALAQADLLLLATPVRTIIALAERLGPQVRPGTIVTDVGSTKMAIVTAWEQHLAEGATFVGAHPIFGLEVSGIQHANADLPAGCRYAITPGARATAKSLGTVTRLAQAAGAIPKLIGAFEHDEAVAVISHLPQVVATALAATAGQTTALDLAGSGFADTTRLASSPAGIWLDIFMTNRASIKQAISAFQATLAQLESAIDGDDRDGIYDLFDQAHAARKRIAKGI